MRIVELQNYFDELEAYVDELRDYRKGVRVCEAASVFASEVTDYANCEMKQCHPSESAMIRFEWYVLVFSCSVGVHQLVILIESRTVLNGKTGENPVGTLRACAEYGQIASSYTVQHLPPINQVVEIKPARPTEYEVKLRHAV